MLQLLFGISLFTGIPAFICPPPDGFTKYTYGNDGSCYSQVESYSSRNEVYPGCARSNAYLPIIINAFQNAVLQQKTTEGEGPDGSNLTGIWLGLTCTGHAITSCTWDDGTPMTRNSYHDFERGFPNATIGACVYHDVKTGKWKSQYRQVCSAVVSLSPAAGYLGAYCKYTPTNHVPICPPWNRTFPRPLQAYPDYFDGHCYNIYDSNNTADAENLCTQKCGHLVSIHSEGENSFVRDLIMHAGYSGRYDCTPPSASFLGIGGNATVWTDGTPVDYTKYGMTPDSSSCVFLAVNITQSLCNPPEVNPVPSGYWYTASCNQSERKYAVCKKALVNDCDGSYVPFPTKAPTTCHGPQYLGAAGTVYAPGYPYYPLGQQPNVCEYIQKLEGGHPSMDVSYAIRANFLPNVTISKFDFYSSEDPNDTPFYSFDGYPYFLPPVVSPTNILRAVYTTIGDPKIANDWTWLTYSTTR